MIKVASLYTGVGGLDWGFILSEGFEHVFANEWNKDAASTFKLNYERLTGHAPTFLQEGDIAKYLDNVPAHDVLLGGFPCPSWSIAGNREGFEDVRGQEFFNCLKVVHLNKPQMFVFENVKGLLSHNNGESLAYMKTLLVAEGYNVEVTLHKFNNYGIPQRRERVFIVGICNDISPFAVAFDKKPAASIREVLAYVSANCKLGENNHNLHIGNGKSKVHWIKVLHTGENLARVPEEVIRAREQELGIEPRAIPKTQQGYIRMQIDVVAPTMMFGNTCVPIHPLEDRSISVREAATFQSFPLDFVFCGGIAAQYKQVGNAVSYKMGFKLADVIGKHRIR